MENGEQANNDSNKQSRAFCFTLNNPRDEELELIRSLQCTEELTYFIGGLERGESGTPHVQGYLEVSRKCRFGGLRSRYPWLLRAALFVARGSGEQNTRYCSKDGNLLREVGSPRKAGKRSDLEEIRKQIVAGVSDLVIAEQSFSRWCIYRRSFAEYRRLIRPRGALRLTLRVTVIVGSAGIGKTRFVYQSEPDLFRVPPGGRWYDGYSGEEAVLIDDYAGDIPYRLFLQLLDIYPVRLECKGGFIDWEPTRIYITSNKDVDRWYPEEDCSPLQRRIHRLLGENDLVALQQGDELMGQLLGTNNAAGQTE